MELKKSILSLDVDKYHLSMSNVYCQRTRNAPETIGYIYPE